MASEYPNRPALSAIVQQGGLNRSGLVADCLFPPVKTACKFSYVNWTDELLALVIEDESVGCSTDVHEIDTKAYKLVDASVQPKALSQVLDECCTNICGDDSFQNKIEQGKTRQLMNKLLLSREKRAIDLALLDSAYTALTTQIPANVAAGTDGKSFTLAAANWGNASYGLRSYFAGIQNNLKTTPARNVMVTDLATLNILLSHPSFIGAGCQVDPITTPDKAAALLGVSKICIANTSYHDGISATPNMTKLWPAGVILFLSSYEFVTSQDFQFSFGISAYSEGFKQFTWLDEKKGAGAGALMQKQSHDYTEIVLSYQAATKVTLLP